MDLQSLETEEDLACLAHAGTTIGGASDGGSTSGTLGPIAFGGGTVTGTPSLPAGYRWQATRTSPKVISGGTTSEQTTIANAQRGAKRHPGGGVRRSGGEPGITSSVRRSVRMFGNDESSFWV